MGPAVLQLAVGMLLYTVIVSPGYFAEKGEWAYVGMFAVVLALALVSLACYGNSQAKHLPVRWMACHADQAVEGSCQRLTAGPDVEMRGRD